MRSISDCNTRKNSPIKNETSSAGRRQFSLLKANTVRYLTPSVSHALTARRNASTPFFVTEYTRHQPLFGPAPIAVHDDGDVLRHSGDLLWRLYR